MTAATILVVCTGNIRRSPTIEALLRAGTSSVAGLATTGVSISSAGVRALIGEDLDGLITAELTRLGLPLPDRTGWQVTEEDITAADLILTAEREHRSAVVTLVPSAVRRTFTLREFAALGAMLGRPALRTDSDVAARLHRLIDLAPSKRAARVVRRADVDDLPDMRRRTRRAARDLVRDATESAETILRLLEPEAALSLVRPHKAGEPAPSVESPGQLNVG